jgi:hypothetical protein
MTILEVHLNDSWRRMILMPKWLNWRNSLLLAVLVLGISAIGHAQAPKGDLPPHQAALTWTAGTGTTASNAYRCPGTCSATSGTFTVLNSAPITATSFTDSTVSANTTYSWCVTGLVTLSSGPFETPCSAVVTATIPKDAAAAPTNPSVTVQ